MDSLIEAVDTLEKAVRDGVRGKYRRVEGKTVFIRSDDSKVTKGPERLKGRKMVMKEAASSAGMEDDFGSPSAEVMLTDGKKKRKKAMFETEPVVKSLEDRLAEFEAALASIGAAR
jgi:hypothetical protein